MTQGRPRLNRRSEHTSTIMNSLLIAAIVVIVMWVAIMGLYLVISRRQRSIGDEIADLEEQLDAVEKEKAEARES